MIRNMLSMVPTESRSYVKSVAAEDVFRLNPGAGKRGSIQAEVALATVTNEKMPQCSIMAPQWRSDAL